MALSSIFKLFAQTNNSRRGSLSLRERIDSIDLASCQMSYSQFQGAHRMWLGEGGQRPGVTCILPVPGQLPPYHKLPHASSRLSPCENPLPRASRPRATRQSTKIRHSSASFWRQWRRTLFEFSLLMYLLDQEAKSSTTLQKPCSTATTISARCRRRSWRHIP